MIAPELSSATTFPYVKNVNVYEMLMKNTQNALIGVEILDPLVACH